MTDLEIKSNLDTAFANMYGKANIEAYQNLKVFSKVYRGSAPDSLRNEAWRRINEGGVPVVKLEETDDRLLLIVGSGFGCKNPALVELRFRDGMMEMCAWAREGLIRQRTAQKAIRACCQALRSEKN